ncbi:MAG TPA: metal-sensitive transcriptional regulator [Candidatus Methylomirabilis sp.]|nr:metal-sensitive transcriptional regulator [Candidatus Methylomirabilis sp.]
MMDPETKHRTLARLRRIEGQVQGVQRMVEEDKYCVDVMLQISAIQGALEQVSKMLMHRHIESCVMDSMKAGSDQERAKKIEELIEVFSRYSGFSSR